MNSQFSPILMCRPSFYEVGYVINPWMSGNLHRSSRALAEQQWQGLYATLSRLTSIVEIEPQAGCPDLVFTANAGLVIGNIAVPSRFLHPERQVEEPHFRRWFEQHDYVVRSLPPDIPFEGAGDALLDRALPLLWAAYGFRTELQAHAHLMRIFEIEVVSLRLTDPRFYHLDTCFCPLENGFLLYYPPAFDAASNAAIERRIPVEKRLILSETDALTFACNAVNLGPHIVLNRATDALKTALTDAGFQVLETPLDEFMKAGGAAKCLTLRTREAVASRISTREIAASIEPATIADRILLFKGHLLDSGTLSRALDAVIDGGGSFKILDFALGEQRHSPSKARVQVSAPSTERLDSIVAQLVDLGGSLESQALDTPSVQLEAVTQNGVAPDDFYVTTIYPTEIRYNGQWLRVQKQRMDAVIALSSAGEPEASCKLIRDLVQDERIVVGVEGIRTRRNITSGQNTEKKGAAEEFHFMGAGISSERRVELAVENIAWELQRLRDQHRKVAVVAGPVVIHTGGGPYLARLIEQGYISVLLAGNALAVHDIEQSLFGTSLGVDMGRGTAVQGGHRHHLRAINMVRRYGGIAQAVAAGALTSGIFYECIKKGVPFSLAGSIRDDGPLPDTQMDLIQAQNEYARLLENSQMTLLLSSMLHSIGAGNMTPAGVKLVCVDINPAVVTKLSDRGSLESVGIVTDVGLFLRLLVQQLEKN